MLHTVFIIIFIQYKHQKDDKINGTSPVHLETENLVSNATENYRHQYQ